MKTILCFGDSLTWGFDATTGGRHPYDTRWPQVLAAGLGEDHVVLAEGLNGRTTCYDDMSAHADRNGARVLPTLLATHEPLDLVVIMLGTNDMKRHTGGGWAFQAKIGMQRLVEIVASFCYRPGFTVPKVLIVSPPPFCVTEDEDFTAMFTHALNESRQLRVAYEQVAAEMGCAFFDAARVCETTPLDGVHLDAENTRRLGEALVAPVKDSLGRA